MEALIARITQATGLDAVTVEKAVGMILAFLVKEGSPEDVGKLLDSMPGAREAAASAGDGGPGGVMGGLMGIVPGGGVMALGQKLMAAGVPMGQMQTLGHELFAHARETAGEDTLGAIVGSVPGLSQFV